MLDKTISFLMESKNRSYNAIININGIPFNTLKKMQKDFLHTKEEMVFESYIYEAKQFSFLQGRYAAKQALSAFLKISRTAILIDHGTFFQPVVKTEISANVMMSLSHSQFLSTCLVYDEEILCGIDLEFNNPDKNWLKLIPLAETEKNISLELTEEQYILFWCSKESLAKAIKIGFTADLQIFEIDKVEKLGTYFQVSFRFFPHFKAYVFFYKQYCFSIAVPGNIHLNVSNMINLFLADELQ